MNRAIQHNASKVRGRIITDARRILTSSFQTHLLWVKQKLPKYINCQGTRDNQRLKLCVICRGPYQLLQRLLQSLKKYFGGSCLSYWTQSQVRALLDMPNLGHWSLFFQVSQNSKTSLERVKEGKIWSGWEIKRPTDRDCWWCTVTQRWQKEKEILSFWYYFWKS